VRGRSDAGAGRELRAAVRRRIRAPRCGLSSLSLRHGRTRSSPARPPRARPRSPWHTHYLHAAWRARPRPAAPPAPAPPGLASRPAVLSLRPLQNLLPPADLGGSLDAPTLSCTAEGELEPASFVCAPYVCPTLDCWSLRSRERPRLQGLCPNCWYGCLDTSAPPTDRDGAVSPNPGTCTIGCRDGFREEPLLATDGACAAHSDETVPHHTEDCEPLAGFQPCWGGNAGGIACVPTDKPCPTAPNASYAGMTATCVASTCPAPDLGPTLKGALADAKLSSCERRAPSRIPQQLRTSNTSGASSLPRSAVWLRGRRADGRGALRDWLR
jgi:hypothetical protein